MNQDEIYQQTLHIKVLVVIATNFLNVIGIRRIHKQKKLVFFRFREIASMQRGAWAESGEMDRKYMTLQSTSAYYMPQANFPGKNDLYYKWSMVYF